MKVTINGWAVSAPFQSIDPAHTIPHRGIDFAIPQGTPIPSIGDGVVTAMTDEGNASFGKSIHIHMKDGNDVIYGHLSQWKVMVGQQINSGDIVGFSGNTGDSTGPHLHIQVMQNGHVINPDLYIRQLTLVNNSEVPWWDVQGHVQAAVIWLEHWTSLKLYEFFDWAWHGIFSVLDAALPTLACIGILWYMVPFLPKHEKGAKVTGASLVGYLFYILIRSAY